MTDKPRITRNAAQCRKCGDLIVSKHQHDFVRCKCGTIAVDGGSAYLKRTGNFADFIEMSEFEPTPNRDMCGND
jgi:ribosomal protein S27AE